MNFGLEPETPAAAMAEKMHVADDRRHTKPRGIIHNIKLKLFLFFTTSLLYSAIIWFVLTTSSAEERSEQGQSLNDLYRLDDSYALAILQILQGLMTLASTSLLEHSLELVQRCLSARDQGLSYVVFLILSPATGKIATLRMLFSRSVRRLYKMWALTKLILAAAIYLAALLLFVNTSRVVVYDTVFRYSVTAGVGPFNASYVQPFFDNLASLSPGYPYQVLPYSIYAAVYNLVVNPTQVSSSNPVNCSASANTECDSYFLNGGLSMATPWVPSTVPITNPVVRMRNVPGIQLDFEASPLTFAPSECETYGESGVLIAIRLCLRSTPSSLQAGLFLCERGLGPNNTCLTSSPSFSPNITSSLSLFSRRATITTTTTNYTIIETSHLTPALPLPPPELTPYKLTLRWLLNFTSTDTPAPSSLAQLFWTSPAQLASPVSASTVILAQTWHSILAFPIWLFNANNYGNPALQASEIIPGLPPEFYTTAEVVTPHAKLKVDEGMLVGFAALQAGVLVFGCGVLVWAGCCLEVALPGISSFVLFDSTVRLRHTVGEVEDWGGVMDVDDGRVLEVASRARTYSRVGWVSGFRLGGVRTGLSERGKVR